MRRYTKCFEYIMGKLLLFLTFPPFKTLLLLLFVHVCGYVAWRSFCVVGSLFLPFMGFRTQTQVVRLVWSVP